MKSSLPPPKGPAPAAPSAGNGAKMREALAEIRDAAHVWISIGGISARRTIEMIFDVAKAALAAPARNCDVGTAEEQVERHREWCSRATNYSHCCSDCRNCFARWAQMPYEEGGEQCQEAITR